MAELGVGVGTEGVEEPGGGEEEGLERVVLAYIYTHRHKPGNEQSRKLLMPRVSIMIDAG